MALWSTYLEWVKYASNTVINVSKIILFIVVFIALLVSTRATSLVSFLNKKSNCSSGHYSQRSSPYFGITLGVGPYPILGICEGALSEETHQVTTIQQRSGPVRPLCVVYLSADVDERYRYGSQLYIRIQSSSTKYQNHLYRFFNRSIPNLENSAWLSILFMLHWEKYSIFCRNHNTKLFQNSAWASANQKLLSFGIGSIAGLAGSLRRFQFSLNHLRAFGRFVNQSPPICISRSTTNCFQCLLLQP